MHYLLLTARVLLAAVFTVAGLAKLMDRDGSQQAMTDFGVPKVLTQPFGLLLPVAELVVAAALLPAATAWWGALGALALLLVFVVGISVNLAQGRTPDCHCFGQLHSSPAGWSTLARNGVLTAIAGFVLWQGWQHPGPSATSWISSLTAIQVVSFVVAGAILGLVAAEGWVILNLMQQNGRLLVRIETLETKVLGSPAHAAPAPTANMLGLPVGAPAPPFSLPGLYGDTLTLDALRASSKPVMLIFSDPGCGPCTALLPEIARWQRDHSTKLTIAAISGGKPEDNRAKSTEHGVTHILLQKDREIANAYQAYGTPTAVIIQPDGTIGSPLAPGADAIRALLVRTIGTPAPALSVLPQGAGNGGNGHTPPSRVGTPAPAVKLPDLSGTQVDLADFRGSKTLVLFWNPGCGFCQRMIDDLRAWEAHPPKGAPKLLVVSSGTVEINQQLGLTSPVVLDQGFTTGQAFGASGTPSAVLVDAKGKIASEVAVGAPNVLALARTGQEHIKLAST
ncbi:MAG: redoxin domain-containing protein [Herpetosiphonaceae bacterium]|nr:redoxin domain-containing protein [Herpetosiphonaceae bacterium]